MLGLGQGLELRLDLRVADRLHEEAPPVSLLPSAEDGHGGVRGSPGCVFNAEGPSMRHTHLAELQLFVGEHGLSVINSKTWARPLADRSFGLRWIEELGGHL